MKKDYGTIKTSDSDRIESWCGNTGVFGSDEGRITSRIEEVKNKKRDKYSNELKVTVFVSF